MEEIDLFIAYFGWKGEEGVWGGFGARAGVRSPAAQPCDSLGVFLTWRPQAAPPGKNTFRRRRLTEMLQELKRC